MLKFISLAIEIPSNDPTYIPNYLDIFAEKAFKLNITKNRNIDFTFHKPTTLLKHFHLDAVTTNYLNWKISWSHQGSCLSSSDLLPPWHKIGLYFLATL